MTALNQPKIEQNYHLTPMAIRVMMGLSNLPSINQVRAFFVAQIKYITRGQYVALGFCRITTRLTLVGNGKFDTYAKFQE